MSQGVSGTESEDESLARRTYRTVTPEYFGRPDAEMTFIGIAYFLGMLVLLVPLLPFILVIWVVGKVFDMMQRNRSAQ